jgi:hypothetical protein
MQVLISTKKLVARHQFALWLWVMIGLCLAASPLVAHSSASSILAPPTLGPGCTTVRDRGGIEIVKCLPAAAMSFYVSGVSGGSVGLGWDVRCLVGSSYAPAFGGAHYPSGPFVFTPDRKIQMQMADSFDCGLIIRMESRGGDSHLTDVELTDQPSG